MSIPVAAPAADAANDMQPPSHSTSRPEPAPDSRTPVPASQRDADEAVVAVDADAFEAAHRDPRVRQLVNRAREYGAGVQNVR